MNIQDIMDSLGIEGPITPEKAKAIKEFKGTVILVSHEPEFYQDIVTDVWNLEDWTTKIV